MAIEPAHPPSLDSHQFCLVLVTVPNETAAKAIAHRLLTEKLAACINFVGVESCYLWEGEINHDREVQLLIKTQQHLFPHLSAKLTAIHPYDIPEIIAIPIVAGNAPYLNWIRQSTQPESAKPTPAAIPSPSAIPG
jgi:periplasmic divalent cation tolerance protein